MKKAIELDDLEMVQQIHDLHPEPLDLRTLATAFEFGSLEMVQWIIDNRSDRRCCLPGIQSLCRLCVLLSLPKAGMRDGDRVLPWLFAANSSFQPNQSEIRFKSLGLTKWLDDLGLLTQSKAQELMVSIIGLGPPTSAPVLTYLIKRGFSVGETALASAMASGGIDPQLVPILDIVVESHLCDSFRDKFSFAAVRSGGAKVLRWDIEYIKTAPSNFLGTIYNYLQSNGGRKGHLELMKWLYIEAGMELDVIQFGPASSDDDVLELLQSTHGAGVKVSTKFMEVAVREGRLRVVQWVWGQMTKLSPRYINYMDLAAIHGHLPVLQWLHDNNIGQCSAYAMTRAAGNGYLDVVEWLHYNRSDGCYETALEDSSYNGHFEVVKWLIAHRSEGDAMRAMIVTAHSGNIEILDWLAKNCEKACINCLQRALIRTQFVPGDSLRDSLQWGREHSSHSPDCMGECVSIEGDDNRPSLVDRPGASLVIKAVQAGDAPLVRDLVEYYPECRRAEAAKAAACLGRLSLLRWLVETSTEELNFSGLANIAARRGQQSVLEWLLSGFKDRVDWAEVRVSASRGKHSELVRWLDARVPELF